MSRFEIKSFTQFAGNYFHYIATACTENKLTALAKLFGVFTIGVKNQQTAQATRMDILVLENLFYQRNIAQKFDLKGSMRNRLVLGKLSRSAVEADLVLMDENLLKKACNNPLYVHPHSKTALNIAIANDSHFLSSNSIMDYSLLVGVDEDRKELVIGIIDYCRNLNIFLHKFQIFYRKNFLQKFLSFWNSFLQKNSYFVTETLLKP